MFLDYLSLALLIAVVVVIFYGVIAIHDIPHAIAKHRDHPHQDAIGAAGWVSLFMLGALWPLLWIWAMAYRPERGWGFGAAAGSAALKPLEDRVSALEAVVNERSRT
jgi:hypothetical protein